MRGGVRRAQQLPARAGRLQRRTALPRCRPQLVAGPRPAGAQHAQRLPEDPVSALYPACAGAQNHCRADHGDWLAERPLCVQCGIPGVCAVPCHGAEPPPHGVPHRGSRAAAHDVRRVDLHERDGLSAALAVADLLSAARHAGHAQSPCGLVRGGRCVVLPTLLK